MKTRVRRLNGQVELAHTNDATAFSERPLIAIIENFQTPQGDVIVPEYPAAIYGWAREDLSMNSEDKNKIDEIRTVARI